MVHLSGGKNVYIVVNLQRLRIIVLSFLGGISMLLPWKSSVLLGEHTTTTGKQTNILLDNLPLSDGWLCFALFFIVIAITGTGNRRQPISSVKRGFIVLFALAACLVPACDYYLLIHQPPPIADSNLVMTNHAAYGLYLTLAFGIAVMIAAFLPAATSNAVVKN